MSHNPFTYIRDYYQVPAEVGRRVRFEGKKEGVITSATNQYINIHFDGEKKPRGPFHPTWEMEYLEMGAVPKMTRSQERYARYRSGDGAWDNFRQFLGYEKEERRAHRLGFSDVGQLHRWEAAL